MLHILLRELNKIYLVLDSLGNLSKVNQGILSILLFKGTDFLSLRDL
jgi:hypothetical protein